MKHSTLVIGSVGYLLLCCSGFAWAQEPSPSVTSAPTELAPPTRSFPPDVDTADMECLPKCRDRFTCVRGTCVSICNPPCPADEMCTSEAQCVAKQPPLSYQTAAPYSAPQPVHGQSTELGEETPGDANSHDGFFLRLGIGVALTHGWWQVELPPEFGFYGGRTFEDSWSGAGPIWEVSLGGTVARGLVVGGGMYHSIAFADRDSQIAMFCPIVDYYPDPRAGFHLTGGPCLATAIFQKYEFMALDNLETGFGLTSGIGLEKWISEQWSVGGLARLQYARIVEDVGYDNSHNALIIGASFVATYH